MTDRAQSTVTEGNCRECGRKVRRVSAGPPIGWSGGGYKWVNHAKSCSRRKLAP
jgi:hypothetical protein